MFLSDELERNALAYTGSIDAKKKGLEVLKEICLKYAVKPDYSPAKIASIYDAVAIRLRKFKADTFIKEGQMDEWAKSQQVSQQDRDRVAKILSR